MLDDTPRHLEFMDNDMRSVWDRLGPMPQDLILSGGTALAMYLNHRQSTDFDFVTEKGEINTNIAYGFPYLEFVPDSIVGGAGMVDAGFLSKTRLVRFNFAESGGFTPHPRYPPNIAESNGVAVLHPKDLMISKTLALVNRYALRDYQDAGAMHTAWQPDYAREINAYKSQDKGFLNRIVRATANIPEDVAEELAHDELQALNDLTRVIVDLLGHNDIGGGKSLEC